MRRNPPSIDAREKAADGARGDAGKRGAMAKPPCHGFRGKVVHEHPLHEVPERRVVHDAHPLIFAVFSPDIRFVVGLAGVIAPAHAVPYQLIRNG